MKQHVADTLQPFLSQHLEALNAVANGDSGPIKALCSRSDDISQCGFWGGVESGWDKVSERWDWVAAQFVPGPGSVTTVTLHITVTGAMAYGVFIERWWGQITSRTEPSVVSMVRATLIFRHENGAWRSVHRHGDDRTTKAPPT